jgi:hypothetical protein
MDYDLGYFDLDNGVLEPLENPFGFDADGLSGKDLAEVDLFIPQTDATAARDHDGFVVEGIVDVRQSGVDTRRGLIDLGRTLHVESLVGTLVVEDIDKFVEAGLLLQKVGGRRFGGFFFQSAMHAVHAGRFAADGPAGSVQCQCPSATT